MDSLEVSLSGGWLDRVDVQCSCHLASSLELAPLNIIFMASEVEEIHPLSIAKLHTWHVIISDTRETTIEINIGAPPIALNSARLATFVLCISIFKPIVQAYSTGCFVIGEQRCNHIIRNTDSSCPRRRRDSREFIRENCQEEGVDLYMEVRS